MDTRPRNDPEDVLRHAAWMRALALNLLGDPAAADDVVQDASVAAWLHPPARDVALEPWLSRVVRHFAWRRRRGEARRLDREMRTARHEGEPSPAETLERLDLQRTLVDAVRAIDEPLRTTIVLRYFEGLSSADIARVQRVPPGTVRWRLKRGLEELRERLDKRFGSRAGWTAALAPFAWRDVATIGSTTASSNGVLKGVLAMSGAQVTLAAAAAALAIGGLWWALSGGGASATAGVAQASRAELVEPRADPAPDFEAAREVADALAAAPASDAKRSAPDTNARDAKASDPPARVLVDARFVDAHGAPWAGVKLAAHVTWGTEEDPVARALSGVDGRVELEIAIDRRWTPKGAAPSAGYDFVASRPGCAAVKRSATLRAGEPVHLGDVVLRAGVRVLGRVVDEAGAPLAGASIGVVTGDLEDDEGRMRRKGAKTFDASLSTRSADDGGFAIDGVEPGARRLWAHAPVRRYSWTEPIQVPSDRDWTGVELVVTPLLVTDRIEGRVLDPSGQAVPLARLNYYVHSTKDSLMTFVPVDEHGRFQLVIDYDDALYDFTAADREHRFAATTVADVKPGTLDVEIRLHEERLLGVLVVDAERKPIEGAKFELEHRRTGGPARAESRGDGRYDVAIPDDEFRLEVTARGFQRASFGPWTPATVPSPFEVVMQRSPLVRGRVVAAGQPVAGARITLHPHDADARGTVNGYRCVYIHDLDRTDERSGADGSFELDANFQDAFWVRASAEGWTSGETGPIEVTQLVGEASFEVELTHGGAIEGRVLLADGEDGEGTIVALNHGDGEPRTLRAGPKGVFHAEGLMPGKWQVVARDAEIDPGTTMYSSSRDSAPIEWSCEVAAGKTTRFDLDLTRK